MTGTMLKSVRINLNLSTVLTKEKNWIVASCPVLDVHSQGKTQRSAEKNLREAVSLFLEGWIKNMSKWEIEKVTKEVKVEEYNTLMWWAHTNAKDCVKDDESLSSFLIRYISELRIPINLNEAEDEHYKTLLRKFKQIKDIMQK